MGFNAITQWNRETRFRNVSRVLKITPDEINELITVYGATAEVTRGTADTRVTASRILGLGIFAWAAKKRTGDLHVRLTNLNGGVLRSISVGVKFEEAARFWADEFNHRRRDYWANRRASAPGDYVAE